MGALMLWQEALLVGILPCIRAWILEWPGADDSVSERLRRWTRNPLGSARRGSNPLAVVSPKLPTLSLRKSKSHLLLIMFMSLRSPGGLLLLTVALCCAHPARTWLPPFAPRVAAVCNYSTMCRLCWSFCCTLLHQLFWLRGPPPPLQALIQQQRPPWGPLQLQHNALPLVFSNCGPKLMGSLATLTAWAAPSSAQAHLVAGSTACGDTSL